MLYKLWKTTYNKALKWNQACAAAARPGNTTHISLDATALEATLHLSPCWVVVMIENVSLQ